MTFSGIDCKWKPQTHYAMTVKRKLRAKPTPQAYDPGIPSESVAYESDWVQYSQKKYIKGIIHTVSC